MDTSTINSWDKPPSKTTEHLEGKVWKMMDTFFGCPDSTSDKGSGTKMEWSVCWRAWKQKGKWCIYLYLFALVGKDGAQLSPFPVSKLTFSGVVQSSLLDPNDQSIKVPLLLAFRRCEHRCFALKEVPIGYLGAVLLAWRVMDHDISRRFEVRIVESTTRNKNWQALNRITWLNMSCLSLQDLEFFAMNLFLNSWNCHAHFSQKLYTPEN